jgi:hypothetical protein
MILETYTLENRLRRLRIALKKCEAHEKRLEFTKGKSYSVTTVYHKAVADYKAEILRVEAQIATQQRRESHGTAKDFAGQIDQR